MIRPLRRRQRVIVGMLNLLWVAVLAAWAVRTPPDVSQAEVADVLRGAAVAERHLAPPIVQRPSAALLRVDESPVATLVAVRLGDATAWVDMTCDELPALPGLLLAWTPSVGDDDGRLPADAALLGALVSRSTGSYRLPAVARAGHGALRLYSLGHQQLVGDALPLDAARLGPAALEDDR